jgi:hypothetical protein
MYINDTGNMFPWIQFLNIFVLSPCGYANCRIVSGNSSVRGSISLTRSDANIATINRTNKTNPPLSNDESIWNKINMATKKDNNLKNLSSSITVLM